MKRVIGITLVLALLLLSLVGCGVAEPTVREGRFDFSVTLEVAGEIVTLTDVLVCEYVGYELYLDGASLEWDTHFENGVLDEQLKLGESPEGFPILLVIQTGDCHLMGDPRYVSYGPEAYLRMDCEDEEGSWSIYDVEELAVYGLRLISFSHSEPIENEYK